MRKILRPLAEFYDGQSAFITGGTGFLGKVLIEKLLYSCAGINKVYILVREQKNRTAQERVQNILEQPVFTRLKYEKPQVLKKIVPIVGDISKPKLGIKEDDEKLLTDSVSIVFHVAATIKFNEPIDIAMNLNVHGTERLLSLCQRMKNIKALVHVSTAFCNLDRDLIEEVIYPVPISCKEVKEMIETGKNKDNLEIFIKERSNTYLFTKALAENLVAENHGNVPAVIIRPAAVTSSKTEPMVGWIDGWFTATSLMTMMTRGWNRCLLRHPESVIDFIPVDYVVNSMISSAARIESSTDVAVKNVTTSADNPLTYDAFLDIVIKDSIKHKSYDSYPYVHLTRFKLVKSLITIIFQTIPSYVADAFLMMIGKKPRYKKMQARVSVAADSLECITTRKLRIPATKTIALAQSLSPKDKEIFPFNPTDIKWEPYLQSFTEGVRKHLLKNK